MTQPDEVFSKVTEVFRTVLEKPDLELTESMTAKDVDSWDSLNHVNLIISIEEAFKIRIPIQEASRLRDVGHLLSLIRERLA